MGLGSASLGVSSGPQLIFDTRTVNPYLDQGYSYEDIASNTGFDLNQIRTYADATRPGYGVGPQTLGSVTDTPSLRTGGSSTGTNTALQANTVNSIYDSRIGRLQNMYNTLPTQRDQALNAYNQNYALGEQQLNNSVQTGRENLGYQETQNNTQKSRSYRDIAQGIRNTMESGANRLGSMNAIDSSASPMLQYALANLQAKQRGSANDTYSDNQTQIGLARNNMEREFQTQLNSLQAEKRSKIQEIADQFSQIKQSIADQIASSDEARATELANLGRQYTMQALSSIQDLESQYNTASQQWVQNALSAMPQINTQPFQQTAQVADYGTYGRGANVGGQTPSYEDVLATSPLRRIRDSQTF